MWFKNLLGKRNEANQPTEFPKIVRGQMGSYEAIAKFIPDEKDPQLDVTIYDMAGTFLYSKTFFPNNYGKDFSLKYVVNKTVKDYEETQMTGEFDFKLDEFEKWDGEVE